MKSFNWQVVLGVSLIALSILFYLAHYVIFRDAHHIFIFLIGDIAFVFTEVLLVSLIIHRLLSLRERRMRLEKMNMVIGAFFSEVGTQLLAFLSDFDTQVEKIGKELIVTNEWSDKEFEEVISRLKNYDYRIDIKSPHIEDLREFLLRKRDFLLRLLENPNLLEHEAFTGLLHPVFHLTEELTARGNLRDLPPKDLTHLSIDVRRVYVLLVHQWLDYMRYLKANYPYLFSFAMRTNPFDRSATLIIE